MDMTALTLLETPEVRRLVAAWPKVKNDEHGSMLREWAEVSAVHVKVASQWYRPLLVNGIIRADKTIADDAAHFISLLALSKAGRQYKKTPAVKTPTQQAKTEAMKVRKAEYKAGRSRLVLAMIEAGIEYRCQFVGCAVTENLTVDHIVPMSRGGTDEISNLRFLCYSHNSSRQDKLDDEP